MVGVKVFDTTFNKISVISYPVLFMEETGVPGETHRPVASHWQTLSHNVIHISLIEIRTTSVVMSTHCIDSCISNCHMNTATTVPVDVMIYLTIVLSDNHSLNLDLRSLKCLTYQQILLFVKYVKFVNVKNLASTLYAKRLALQGIRGVGSNPGEGVQQNLLAQ
jgi:hypothetical protein